MKYRRVISNNTNKGFSLLELMVALVITGTTAMVTIPYAVRTYDSMKKSNARQLVINDIKYARTQALKNGLRTLITLDSGNNSYKIGYDNIPYASTPVIETLLSQRKLGSGITLAFDKSIIFNSRGNLIGAGNTLQTVTISVYQNSLLFLTITLYPSGAMVYG
jgi:prepilin-type N-terminal cleavage/methylation domain-containing protein